MSNLSLVNFLDSVNDGRVFTVEFYKRTTGEHRVMNCRRGVSKGITGKGHNYNPEKRNLLCVYDMQKAAYRMINLEDLTSLKANGKVYTWSIDDDAFVETVEG